MPILWHTDFTKSIAILHQKWKQERDRDRTELWDLSTLTYHLTAAKCSISLFYCLRKSEPYFKQNSVGALQIQTILNS